MIRVLMEKEGLKKLDVDREANRVTVREKILSHGKEGLGELILRLHIFRCNAGVKAATEYYEKLTAVDDQWLEIRDILQANKGNTLIFLQANTFLQDGEVILEEYEPSVKGVIQSWAERDL